MIIEFEIPGKVKGKQRPRFANGIVYTPKDTINYENWVKTCFMKDNTPETFRHFENPLMMIIDAYFVKPKSNKSPEPTTVRLDVDNIGKAVADSLNGIAYKDDKQIISMTVRKNWGETEKVKVIISYCF